MKDLPPNLVEALVAGGFNSMESTNSGVADLMVSQTETADIVILNKEDLADADTIQKIEQIVLALNPRAAVMRTEFGKVPLDMILGAAGGMGVVQAGVVDDHKDAVEAAAVIIDRSLDVTHAASDCQDPDCTDPNHSHSHSHDHSASCNDPDCTDESHSHAKADASHSHSHSHAEEACNDPDCTDPSHTHEPAPYAGIGSFVYRARRPFHPKRLTSFLGYMPVSRGVPDQEEAEAVDLTESAKATLKNVVRSKGFTWCADSHTKALYWSHAGSSMDMQCIGAWWATLPRDQVRLGVQNAVSIYIRHSRLP